MISTREAQREKRMVAISSVGAAIGLTGIKIVVAVLTGSLGILAEAAHSGLDLVAALMTFFAVRVADLGWRGNWFDGDQDRGGRAHRQPGDSGRGSSFGAGSGRGPDDVFRGARGRSRLARQLV